MVKIRLWSIQNIIIHCLPFPFILYVSLEKMLLLTLPIFPHISITHHGEFEGVGVCRREVDGDSFNSSRLCWTPTGKLALGVVGTLREKTENDKMSD